MYKILICVDLQRDFLTGSLGSEQAKAIVPKVKAKIDEYVERGEYIFFTKDTHFDDYLETPEGKKLDVPHCIKKTEGWEIYDNLDKDENGKRLPRSFIVEKHTFGMKDWDGNIRSRIRFDKFVNNEDLQIHVNEIEIIGIATDVCVVTNALILKTVYPEVKITVDASCCAGITEESHKAALLTMKMCQINVINE